MSAAAIPTPQPLDPYLSLRHVSKTFGTFAALDNVSLDIAQGEFICFLGPSGCGKTTLLRAIAGLDIQTSGSIIQAGHDISLWPVRQRDFGIVFQSYALFPNLTVHENVAYGLKNRRTARRAIACRVAELLALVGLAEQGQKYPAQLSGGQQQRVALARALALAPGLLLLDEPLSALDARVREHLRGELRAVHRRLALTTIMVTHDQEEALTMADRIVVLHEGRVAQIGTPTQIYARPATPFVAHFIGRMNFLAGKLLAVDRLQVDGAELQYAPALERYHPDTPVTVCLRPEEVVIRNVHTQASNVFAARIGAMEFSGHHFATTLHVVGTGLHVTADFSLNDVHDLSLTAGQTIRIGLPPERLRVFPQLPVTAESV
ncbi:MAG: putative 2-aminoethylphosphonate ABC transporter ATP-binding protein [Candidatus Tectimicrobiota bacterium]